MIDATEARLRDCLARYLLANRETGRRMWRNWENPRHHAAKPRAWLEDMRQRIQRQRDAA